MSPITPTELAIAASIALLVGVLIGMGLMVLTEKAVLR